MQLYLNFDHIPEKDKLAKYKSYVIKRADHVPIQYILNEAGFRSLKLYVDENVLIPRPETELLVDEVLASTLEYLEICTKEKRNIDTINILDACTGSGAIAISIASEIESFLKKASGKSNHAYSADWRIIATDKSDPAIKIAQRNAKNILDEGQLGKLEFLCTDIIPDQSDKDFYRQYKNSINIIVSNPPYISEAAYPSLPREVVEYEPGEALLAGKDGLSVYYLLIKSIVPYIDAKLCFLLFETDPSISATLQGLVKEELKKSGRELKELKIKKDYNNRDRILKAII